jgi:hypothetical protein
VVSSRLSLGENIPSCLFPSLRNKKLGKQDDNF